MSRVIIWSFDVFLCIPFFIFPICCFMSSSNSCFLTCIQVSQEADKVVWHSHLFWEFSSLSWSTQSKAFNVVNTIEVDIFLESTCFIYKPRMFKTSVSLHSFSSPVSTADFSKFADILSAALFSSVQFSHSVVSDSLWPHELQHARPPCLSPTPGVYPNPYPLSRWCHSTISSSVFPFSSCPQSFPASESFPRSELFTSGGQSIGVSASTSVLPMNTQDWSLLG